MAKERKDIPLEDRWNVEALYPTIEDWKKDFTKWSREGKDPRWPEIAKFRGKLHESPETLHALMGLYFEIDRHLSRIYTYAHLKHDEDIGNDTYKKAFSEMLAVFSEFSKETSWIEPEILQIPDEVLSKFLKSKILEDYRIHLEKIIRLKPHTLTADKEELLALMQRSLQTAAQSFNAFNNADLKFPPVKDKNGKDRELTHGSYQMYMKDQDRILREGAFKTLHKSFLGFENTLCELINGHVQNHLFQSKARKYSSCLEAALFSNQIPVSVYFSLIDAVRKNLGTLHKYVGLRKKLLKYDTLHLYDMSVPLVADVDMSMSYSEAENLVIESVAPLGKEYQKILEKGLKVDRWVDRFENVRKRSGAYSSGTYDSMPYILMNYHGTFRDVMTLAHEAGHSMQTYLSAKHQKYQYSGYSIFVAEVASTFHEELVFRHLMEKAKSKEQKCYLINQKIDDIRSTLFRQAMFAEFELSIHKSAEEGIPLTPTLLKGIFRKLNQDYFGDKIQIDHEIDIEWSRIPHFYSNFYVYQYATGISAALALVDKVEKGGEKARDRYLAFLSGGSSKEPLEILKMAGVDMKEPDAVDAAIGRFSTLVEELSELMK